MRIGIDVGFGHTKAITLEGGKLQAVTYPSLLGQAQDIAAYSLGLGGKKLRAHRIAYQGGEWYVGEEALCQSRAVGMRQDRGRIGSLEERLLALVAIAHLTGDATEVEAQVVTGLPVIWFSPEDRANLARSWRGTHHLVMGNRHVTVTIKAIRVLPQPIGGFYAWALSDSGEARVKEEELLATFAFLDVGWNTTDLTAISQVQPISKWSGGERVGCRRVTEIVDDYLRRQHGLDLSPHEVDAAIKAGQVEVFGKAVSLRPVIDQAIATVSQQIVASATALWGNGERFRKVFVFGGGGVLLGKSLLAAFPHNGELLKEPAQANALGFARFALRNVW